jgi:hypothetical protein
VTVVLLVLLTIVGLGYFAVAKKRGFKFSASFLRLFSFNVEIPPPTANTPEAIEQAKLRDLDENGYIGLLPAA